MANPANFDELVDYGVHPPDAKPFSSRMAEEQVQRDVVAAGCVIVLRDQTMLWAAGTRTRQNKTHVEFNHGPGDPDSGEIFGVGALHTGGGDVSGRLVIGHVFVGLLDATFVPRTAAAGAEQTQRIRAAAHRNGELQLRVRVRQDEVVVDESWQLDA